MFFDRSQLLLLVMVCTGTTKVLDVHSEERTSIMNYVSHTYFPKSVTWTSSTKELEERVQSRASSGVSYHEFLINEASYKFWAIFQLVTVVVLLYSTFAAIYYARYNYLKNLESGQYDDVLFRSLSSVSRPSKLSAQTFQRIMDSISGNHQF